MLTFASSDRDHVALNRAMRERLPAGTRIIGATSSGEIDNEGMHQGCVVASMLTGDLEVGIGLGRGLSEDFILVAQARAALLPCAVAQLRSRRARFRKVSSRT